MRSRIRNSFVFLGGKKGSFFFLCDFLKSSKEIFQHSLFNPVSPSSSVSPVVLARLQRLCLVPEEQIKECRFYRDFSLISRNDPQDENYSQIEEICEALVTLSNFLSSQEFVKSAETSSIICRAIHRFRLIIRETPTEHDPYWQSYTDLDRECGEVNETAIELLMGQKARDKGALDPSREQSLSLLQGNHTHISIYLERGLDRYIKAVEEDLPQVVTDELIDYYQMHLLELHKMVLDTIPGYDANANSRRKKCTHAIYLILKVLFLQPNLTPKQSAFINRCLKQPGLYGLPDRFFIEHLMSEHKSTAEDPDAEDPEIKSVKIAKERIVKLKQIEDVIKVYQKWTGEAETSVKILPEQCQRSKKLLLERLIHFTEVIRDPNLHPILRSLFLYTRGSIERSLLEDLVEETAKSERHRSNLVILTSSYTSKRSKMRAEDCLINIRCWILGFGTDRGRITHDWEEIIRLLVPNPWRFLGYVFATPDVWSEETNRDFKWFVTGPQLIHYPDYAVWLAFGQGVTDSQLLNDIRKNLLSMDQEQSKKLADALLSERVSITYLEINRYLDMASTVPNPIQTQACHRLLFLVHLNRLPRSLRDPSILSEQDLLDIISLPESQRVSDIFAAKPHLRKQLRFVSHDPTLDKDARFQTLDADLFPNMTNRVLEALLKRYPDLNILFTPDKSKLLCDVTLKDSRGNQSYMNSLLLKRASPYFAGLLDGGMQSSQIFKRDGVLELAQEEYDFLVRWSGVFAMPVQTRLGMAGNGTKSDAAKMDASNLPASVDACICQLAIAKRFLLPDHFIREMDKYYTEAFDKIVAFGEQKQVQEIELSEQSTDYLEKVLKGTLFYDRVKLLLLPAEEAVAAEPPKSLEEATAQGPNMNP